MIDIDPKKLKNLANYCLVALIIAFFFPWIEVYRIASVRGYQLPNFDQTVDAAYSILFFQEPLPAWAHWTPYAIPLYAFYSLGKQFFDTAVNEVADLHVWSGVLGLIFSWSYVIGYQFMGLGALITFITSIILILIGLYEQDSEEEPEEPWEN